MGRRTKAWLLVPLLALATFMLSGCQGVLNPQGPDAKEQLGLIELSFWIMFAVLLVVFTIFFYVIIRFRKRKGQTGYPKQVEGNHVLEIIWTVVPFILIMVLAVPTVYYTFALAKDYSKDKNAVHISVTGHQFWWEFDYKDPNNNLVTANDLYVPVGKMIYVTVQSADVNHAFWMPEIAGKIDANPGTGAVNHMSFSVDKPGVYKGKCAELCGASHALMDFKVIAVSQADYQAWITKMKTPVATAADVQQGQQIFQNQCITCHSVDPTGRGFGPNLNHFGDRTRVASYLPNNVDNLKKWINDPQSVKPGAMMPKLGLKPDQIDAVAKYLESLK